MNYPINDVKGNKNVLRKIVVRDSMTFQKLRERSQFVYFSVLRKRFVKRFILYSFNNQTIQKVLDIYCVSI